MLKGNWTASLTSWFLLWLLLYPVAFDGNLFLASTQCNGYDFYLGLVWFSAAFESARKNSHRALPCFSSCTSSKAQCNKRPHDFLLMKNVKLPCSNLIPKLNVSKSITRQCFLRFPCILRRWRYNNNVKIADYYYLSWQFIYTLNKPSLGFTSPYRQSAMAHLSSTVRSFNTFSLVIMTTKICVSWMKKFRNNNFVQNRAWAFRLKCPMSKDVLGRKPFVGTRQTQCHTFFCNSKTLYFQLHQQ